MSVTHTGFSVNNKAIHWVYLLLEQVTAFWMCLYCILSWTTFINMKSEQYRRFETLHTQALQNICHKVEESVKFFF